MTGGLEKLDKNAMNSVLPTVPTSSTIAIGALALAACSFSGGARVGTLHVTNQAHSTASVVRIRVANTSTPSDAPFSDAVSDKTQILTIAELKPGETRDVQYSINSEYYIDVSADVDGRKRLRENYGYAEDSNPFSLSHRIVVDDTRIIVDDGE